MDGQDLKSIEKLFEKQTEQFQRYLGVIEESFQHKLDIVVDGVQMLVEKVDRLDVRIGSFETKVDGVALDLTAHRTDTEAHHGMYRVKEG